MTLELQTTILLIASIIGSISFSFSGFLIGVRKKLDVMGILIIAFLTANGGGILLAFLIMQKAPILESTLPFWLTGATVLSAFIFQLHKKFIENNFLFIAFDALGLVAFTISGAIIGLELGLHIFGIMALAFLNATGGGIARDLLVREIPLILHSDFYGSISLLLSIMLYGLHYFNLLNPYSVTFIFVFGVLLRLYAYHKDWSLPKIK